MTQPSAPVRNVLIIGASGNLGKRITSILIDSAHLNVSALQREGSHSAVAAGAKIIKTDYSPASLRDALAGQDVAICLLGGENLALQPKIIDAAIAAGVKRFFPSEFGSDTSSDELLKYVPILQGKRDVQDHLRQLGEQGKIEWTALMTGPFLDWTLEVGFFPFDLANRHAEVWDGGETEYDSTSVGTIGRGLVTLLTEPEAWERSKNAVVHLSGFSVSQNKMLAALEKADGSKWTTEQVDADERYKAVEAALAKGQVHSTMADSLRYACFSKKALGKFESTDNEWLGVDGDDLDEVVKKVVEKVRSQ